MHIYFAFPKQHMKIVINHCTLLLINGFSIHTMIGKTRTLFTFKQNYIINLKQNNKQT